MNDAKLFAGAPPFPVGEARLSGEAKAFGFDDWIGAISFDASLPQCSPALVDRAATQQRKACSHAHFTREIGHGFSVVNGEISAADSIAGEQGAAPGRERLLQFEIETLVLVEPLEFHSCFTAQSWVEPSFGGAG